MRVIGTTVLSLSLAALAAGTILNGTPPQLACQDPFIQNLHSQILETVERVDSVPGLTPAQFNSIKERVKEQWNTIVNQGVLEIESSDKEIRDSFVSLQSIIECVLSRELNHSVQSLTGVIHTPMPDTPLCMEGDISAGLVAPSIEQDPSRLFTVTTRAKTIREFLSRDGNLYIVYPESGMAKRTPAQQEIYKKELENYKETQNHPAHLFDCPLPCESIENELTGAFYVFENNEGKKFAFAIKITQANNVQDVGTFGLWFGELKEGTPCHTRISTIKENVLKFYPLPIL